MTCELSFMFIVISLLLFIFFFLVAFIFLFVDLFISLGYTRLGYVTLGTLSKVKLKWDGCYLARLG